jgi:hypothetical protein
MPHTVAPSQRPISSRSTVRVDLRGFHTYHGALYPTPQHGTTYTYTVEVIRKPRKKASPKRGGENSHVTR